MKAVRTLMLLFVIFFVMMVAVAPVMAQATGPEEAPPSVDYGPEVIMGFAGVVVSVIFSYAPKLRVKYAALDEGQKKEIMAGVMAVITIGITALSCTGFISTSIQCTKFGLERVLIDFLIMVIANQGIYGISPKLPDVLAAKANRDPAQDWVNNFGAGK